MFIESTNVKFMVAYRIKYKGLVSQLYVPKKKNDGVRAIVVMPGLPMSFNLGALISKYLDSGDYVFYPFYSGTYDSAGVFTGDSAVADTYDFAEMIQQKSVDELYYNVKIDLPKFEEVVFLGMSFSAVIALHADTSPCDKIVLLSPVLMYNQEDISRAVSDFDFKSQMDSLLGLLRNAYPFTYRMGEHEDVLRSFLYGDSEYSRTQGVVEKLRGLNIPTLVVHGRKDLSVSIAMTEKMLADAGNEDNITFWPINHAAHSISSYGDELIDKVIAF